MISNLAISSACNLVGGEDSVTLATKCYMKINLFVTDSVCIVADGFIQYIQPTESTDDHGNLLNISKYRNSTLLPIYNLPNLMHSKCGTKEITRFKVIPHDGRSFHKTAHHTLNFYVFPIKFGMHNNPQI